MKKFGYALAIVVVMTAFFITGCQGNSDKGAEQAEEVKLNILIAQPRFRDQYEAYIDRFAEKYMSETGITVTYELEMPPADKATEIVNTRLATGSDLDLFMFHAINQGELYTKAGYLVDLSGEEWVDTLYESVRTAVSAQGTITGVPLETLTWGYLYNKDLFAELGIEPAMTLAEMEENIRLIEAAGKNPFLSAYNESWIPQLFLPLTVGGFATTSHPDFIEEMYADESSFAELSGMFDVIDLAHAHTNDDGLEIGGIDGCAEFAGGDYAMWVQGPWFSASILEVNPEFNLGVAPLPVSNDPEQTKINASVSTTIGVYSGSNNTKVAKELVAYFMDAEASSDFFQSTQFNPLATIHEFPVQPWIEEANEYMGAGKAYVDLPIPQAVKDESGKILQAYYLGSASQADVIDALDTAWKRFNEVNSN